MHIVVFAFSPLFMLTNLLFWGKYPVFVFVFSVESEEAGRVGSFLKRGR